MIIVIFLLLLVSCTKMWIGLYASQPIKSVSCRHCDSFFTMHLKFTVSKNYLIFLTILRQWAVFISAKAFSNSVVKWTRFTGSVWNICESVSPKWKHKITSLASLLDMAFYVIKYLAIYAEFLTNNCITLKCTY
jgi:hypothetical protein